MGQRAVIMIVILLIFIGTISIMLFEKQSKATDEMFDNTLAMQAYEMANSFAQEAVRDLFDIVDEGKDHTILNKEHIGYLPNSTCMIEVVYAEYSDLDYPLPNGTTEFVPQGDYLIISLATIKPNNGMIYMAETHILLGFIGGHLVAIEELPQFLPEWFGVGPLEIRLGYPRADEVSIFQELIPLPELSEEEKLWKVYYTDTGIRYHKVNCRYLAHSCYEATLPEAIRRGLTPCLVCCPPLHYENDPVPEWVFRFTLSKSEVEELHNILYSITNNALFVKGTAGYNVTIITDQYVLIPETVTTQTGSGALISIWGKQGIFGIPTNGDPGTLPSINKAAQTVNANLYSMGPIQGPTNPRPTNTNPGLGYVRQGSNTLPPAEWLHYDGRASSQNPEGLGYPLLGRQHLIKHWHELPTKIAQAG